MQTFEYKAIPAPVRAKKIKGVSKAELRFAETLAEELNTQAAENWEFLRAETLPFEERQGLTGTRSGSRTLLIFRRPTPVSEAEATRAAVQLLENEDEDFS